jgi:hypothetical protein
MKHLSITLLFFVIPVVVLNSFSIDLNTHDGNTLAPDRDNYRNWSISSQIWETNSTGEWLPDYIWSYQYNPLYPSTPDTLKYWKYTSSVNDYRLNQKTVFTYFPGHEYIGMMQVFDIAENGNQTPSLNAYISYDVMNRLTMMYVVFYDPTAEDWIPVMRFVITYNSNTDFDVNIWNAGDGEIAPYWENVTFVLDTQGRITQEINQRSADSLNWVNYNKTVHTYHPNDTSSSIQFISDVAHHLPLYMIMDSQPYFGMQSEQILQNWSGTAWQNSLKYTYTYGTEDELTIVSKQDWNGSGWVDNQMTTYTYYDTNQMLFHLLESHYDSNALTWVQDNRCTYNWNEYTNNEDSTIPSILDLALSVYPNPFQSNLSIRISSKTNAPVEIQIYNLKGQLVRSLKVYSSLLCNWDGRNQKNTVMSPGIYLVKATQNGHTVMKKILRIAR